MERLTRKLKKGGYSANRHSEAQLTERLDQLKGVHKQWLQDVSDMMTGMKQSEAAGQAGALTLMMLQAGYAAIVRIGRRFGQRRQHRHGARQARGSVRAVRVRA